MKNNLLTEIVNEVEPLLSKHGFGRRSKQNTFIRKNKDDYKREEKISFYARRHRTDIDAIYISCFVGIYYPTVRKVYRTIIEDHLSKYPIIAGSISNFSPRRNYLSTIYKDMINKSEVVAEIQREIIEGAFCLTTTFPNLSSLYEGFKNRHEFFSGNEYDVSRKIEIASIIYLLEGKNSAFTWLKLNLGNEKNMNQVFENFEKLK